MRTDIPFLLATTVAIGSIIGGELAPMLQAHALAHDLWIGFWLLFLVALWGYHFRQPLLSGFGRLAHQTRPIPPAPTVQPTDEWMSLADAARHAMDHAHSTISGPILEGAWRKLSDDETDLLHFWAYRVTAQLGVPLWGTKILSSRVELIPLDDLQGAHFRERATRVDLGNGEPMTDFENLRVKRRDLDAGLAQIASRNWQPDQQA